MPSAPLLSPEILDRIHTRAPGYDAANEFCTEDFAELTDLGYLRALVPVESGGLGLTLRDLLHEQAALAAAAPATALAVNMHHVCVGIARFACLRGDRSLDQILVDAGRGEVFGFGYSEAGNDLVLLGARTQATSDGDGGYTYTGRKIFTSLSPAWTRLIVHGTDTASADSPRIVHSLLSRDGGGVTVLDDWDTLGMRATQSRTTVLDGAPAPADRVLRRLPPGPSLDPLIVGIFTTFSTLVAAVYTGIGARALELGVEAAQRRTSFKNDGAALATDPDIRWRLADAALAQDALWPQLDAIATDIDGGVDHGAAWFRMAAGLKVRATETAKSVVDAAIRAAGGATYFAGNELGRLYRDVLAGIFHPSNDESAHATIASSLLGPLP